MSGRNRQRYSQHSDYTLNSHEDFARSSLLQCKDPPIVKPWAFPSFLQAGQPPKPLEYFHRTPELEGERRADTTTLSSRYTSSPGHLLLAPNEQECVYKAIAWKKCFKRHKLGEQDVAHKGLCILSHKTACANYIIWQRGPYVCCGTPTFEVRRADSNWCFGEGCPGLMEYAELSIKPPFFDWYYHLEFYYGRDDRKLAVERNNRQLKRAQLSRERERDQREARQYAQEEDRENSGELSQLYGENTGDFDDGLQDFG